MKKLMLASLISFSSFMIQAKQGAEIYLNQDVGFNVKGYKYSQQSLPCDVDKFLVSDLVTRANKQGLAVKTVKTGDNVPNTGAPLLAIDIDSLSLGREDFNFGNNHDRKRTLPSVKVTVGLFKPGSEQVLAKHSCAISTLNELNPMGGSVLDLGTYGVTVCDATQKCLKNLSKDIIQWVQPQIDK